MPSPSPRNHRSNPYPADRAMASVHHSVAGVLWRFRTETITLTVGRPELSGQRNWC